MFCAVSQRYFATGPFPSATILDGLMLQSCEALLVSFVKTEGAVWLRQNCCLAGGFLRFCLSPLQLSKSCSKSQTVSTCGKGGEYFVSRGSCSDLTAFPEKQQVLQVIGIVLSQKVLDQLSSVAKSVRIWEYHSVQSSLDMRGYTWLSGTGMCLQLALNSPRVSSHPRPEEDVATHR